MNAKPKTPKKGVTKPKRKSKGLTPGQRKRLHMADLDRLARRGWVNY